MAILNDVLPDAQIAVQNIGETLSGLTRMAMRDSSADAVAKGSVITAPYYNEGAVEDIVSSMNYNQSADPDYTQRQFVIDKSRRVKIPWRGEEVANATNKGVFGNLRQTQIESAMKQLMVEVERDLFFEAVYGSTLPTAGTSGSEAFATNTMGDFAEIEKILNEAHAPQAGRNLILTSKGLYSLQANGSNLYKANENGNTNFKTGSGLGTVFGISMDKTLASGQKRGNSIDALTIDSIDATRTILTIASGSVVTAEMEGGIGFIAGGGYPFDIVAVDDVAQTITLSRPVPGTETPDVVSVFEGDPVAGIAGTPDALMLMTRTPYAGKDLAIDATTVTDDKTGLSFRIAWYPGDHMGELEISIAWGTALPNPNHITTLITV